MLFSSSRLAASLLAATLLSPFLHAQQPQAKPEDVAAVVAQRVKDWQPRPEERRFDDIGWAASIREALKLAKEHDRPVFLFSHDGRMAVGRC
jgi:hypothetical protein